MNTDADRVFLSHMQEEVTFLQEHIHDVTFDAFVSDTVLRRAVARRLEIIGEAAKNLSPALRDQHPDVDW